MQVRAAFERHLLALLRRRPAIDLPAVYQLEQLCKQQLSSEALADWRTFWSLAIHFFTALRVAPGREFTESEACAANQVLSGVLLRGQFDVHDTPSADDLQVISHLLFLEQADIISQRLVHDLHHWSQTPDADMPHDVQADAQHMAQLARDVSLNSVHQVADTLAMQLARLRTQRVVADIHASVQGAQEVSRLLQQFAVGNVRAPQENVLAALRGD
jgi:hypothetical protein